MLPAGSLLRWLHARDIAVGGREVHRLIHRCVPMMGPPPGGDHIGAFVLTALAVTALGLADIRGLRAHKVTVSQSGLLHRTVLGTAFRGVDGCLDEGDLEHRYRFEQACAGRQCAGAGGICAGEEPQGSEDVLLRGPFSYSIAWV